MCLVLYSQFTHDCKAAYDSNTIIKFADDTTVLGMITNSDESAYREEVRDVAVWYNLSLTISKTKELIMDYRRKRVKHIPIYINGAVVERVESFKYLVVHITKDLTWSTHTWMPSHFTLPSCTYLPQIPRTSAH